MRKESWERGIRTVTSVQTANGKDCDRWLIVIGVFKLLKGLLFVSLGFGILRLIHRDVSEFLLRLAGALRIDPENKLVNLLLDKAEDLTPHRIRIIGIAIFLYAALDFLEGTGLVLEKTWAEYVTIFLTAAFLPYELFEDFRHVTWIKIVITVINAVVLVYLLWHQRTRLKRRQAC